MHGHPHPHTPHSRFHICLYSMPPCIPHLFLTSWVFHATCLPHHVFSLYLLPLIPPPITLVFILHTCITTCPLHSPPWPSLNRTQAHHLTHPTPSYHFHTHISILIHAFPSLICSLNPSNPLHLNTISRSMHSHHPPIPMHITILIPMQTLHAYIPYLTCIAITPNTHAYHYPHIPITTFLSLHHAMHPVSSHLSMAMHDHILPISIPIVKPTSLSLKLHSYPFS